MPEVRGDWDQAVTRHDQDDVELVHRLAQVNIQAVESNFERLDIPSRKIGQLRAAQTLLQVANQPTCATRS